MTLNLRPQFFRPKTISKVAIIKTKSATIAFFFFSSLILFLLSFSFVTVILEPFLGLRNLPFDAFSLKWLQILVGWFSKNRSDLHAE